MNREELIKDLDLIVEPGQVLWAEALEIKGRILAAFDALQRKADLGENVAKTVENYQDGASKDSGGAIYEAVAEFRKEFPREERCEHEWGTPAAPNWEGGEVCLKCGETRKA